MIKDDLRNRGVDGRTELNWILMKL